MIRKNSNLSTKEFKRRCMNMIKILNHDDSKISESSIQETSENNSRIKDDI